MMRALLALALVGCAGPARVILEAPSSSASISERERAYEELRPLEQVEHTGVAVSRVGNTTVATPYRNLAYLQLNDGRRVIDPRDLEPVVTPSSPTGKAIVAYSQRMEAAQTGFWIGTGATAGISAAMVVGGVAAAVLFQPGPDEYTSTGQILGLVGAVSGLTILSCAPVIGLAFMAGDSTEAGRERETAFNLYDRSLRMRLDLENAQRE